MEKGNTKQQIMEAALDLFSVSGYEATSISQIAEAVGVRKASLYSHFENKQAILDAIVSRILQQYNQHSLFANANWEDPNYTSDKADMSAERVVQMTRGQIRYILHDPALSKARKMLVIEQFQNPKLAAMQTTQNYTDVLKYHVGMMRYLIRQGILRDEDAEVMAEQFCAPVTVWTNLCDREPEREEEVMEKIEKHVQQFFRVYAAQ